MHMVICVCVYVCINMNVYENVCECNSMKILQH